MAVQDTDLLLVQRGNIPYSATAEDLSKKVISDIDIAGGDIPIASASQLGVIRVGNNLQIDAGTGILDAVIPAGLEFVGTWNDAANSPSTGSIAAGQFWIWVGGDNVALTGSSWSAIQNQEVSDRDRVVWSAQNNWAIVRDSGGGGGGIVAVTGTAPIQVAGTADTPDVSIVSASASADGSMSKEDYQKLAGIAPGAQVNVNPTQAYTDASRTLTLSPGGDTTVLPLATTTVAGMMSAADKAQLDSLVSTPGGVSSLTARNGITNNGTAGSPILDVDFGNLPNGNPATAQVMPYDISALGDLP